MPPKKHIIIIAVLSMISLGLGYWYGMPKEEGSGGGNGGGGKKEPAFLKEGLVAYYPFNGNAKDATTNNYHGFLEGPTSTTNRFGQLNQAIAFDGAKDGVSLPNQLFNKLEAFTYAAWLNLEGPGSHRAILSLANVNQVNVLIFMFHNVQSKIEFFHEERHSLSVDFDSFEHHWSQIVVTRESSSASFKVYINGVQKAIWLSQKPGRSSLIPAGHGWAKNRIVWAAGLTADRL